MAALRQKFLQSVCQPISSRVFWPRSLPGREPSGATAQSQSERAPSLRSLASLSRDSGPVLPSPGGHAARGRFLWTRGHQQGRGPTQLLTRDDGQTQETDPWDILCLDHCLVASPQKFKTNDLVTRKSAAHEVLASAPLLPPPPPPLRRQAPHGDPH